MSCSITYVLDLLMAGQINYGRTDMEVTIEFSYSFVNLSTTMDTGRGTA